MLKFSLALKTLRTDIEVRVEELTLYPITIFIGPNASGKSLVARTILNILAEGRYEELLYGTVEGEVVVEVDKMKSVYRLSRSGIYLDQGPSVATWMIYCIPDVRDVLFYILSRESMSGPEPIWREARVLLNTLKELREDLTVDEIVDTWREMCKVIEEKLREHVPQREINLEEVIPLRFIVESYLEKLEDARKVIGWEVLDLGKPMRGAEIHLASSGISSALVLWALICTYIQARKQKPKTSLLLLIEEPELHTHPLQAVTIGMIAAYIVDQIWTANRGKLYILMTTHSPEVLRGCLSTDRVEVYIFKRERNKITATPWDGSAIIPGFTEANIQAISLARKGIEAIRKRREKSKA